MAIALGATLAVGLAAAAASALTIGGAAGVQVAPVYFNLHGSLGIATATSPDLLPVTSASDWLQDGALGIQINLQTPVLQNPQSPSSSMNPMGLQGTPSSVNPFVADSIWTVTNKTDGTLTNAYLIFEGVSLASTTLLPGVYPDIQVGIDRNLFHIVRYTDLSAESSVLFGALSLGPSLEAGASTQIRVRYIVAGALPQNGANLVMPPFVVGGLENVVPEPTTIVLLGSGLALFAAAGRRRCA